MHAIAKGRIDDVSLHHQVLIDEFGRVDVVGVDAAHLGSGQVDLVRLFFGKECVDGGLIRQVQFRVDTGDDAFRRVPLDQQLTHDGRAHHATVASDVDFGMLGHDCARPYVSSKRTMSSSPR